jgi:hypothetical protein
MGSGQRHSAFDRRLTGTTKLEMLGWSAWIARLRDAPTKARPIGSGANNKGGVMTDSDRVTESILTGYLHQQGGEVNRSSRRLHRSAIRWGPPERARTLPQTDPRRASLVAYIYLLIHSIIFINFITKIMVNYKKGLIMETKG